VAKANTKDSDVALKNTQRPRPRGTSLQGKQAPYMLWLYVCLELRFVVAEAVLVLMKMVILAELLTALMFLA